MVVEDAYAAAQMFGAAILVWPARLYQILSFSAVEFVLCVELQELIQDLKMSML